MSLLITSSQLRLRFAQALSRMYQKEVPQYTTLQRLVDHVNAQNHAETSLTAFPRHGAVRLASLSELRTAARFFGVMGMRSVGHYDLSAAALPIHATAFRPVTQEGLSMAPFRIFASVLRLELLAEPLQALARSLLGQRTPVFSQRTVDLVEQAESRGGLTAPEAEELIQGGCETLAWRNQVSITRSEYEALKADKTGNGDLLIDIMAFRNPHLNHLTPATVDIGAVHGGMRGVGLLPKDRVEGPPGRKCDILLRQTSFLAVDEGIVFDGAENKGERGSHCARFGEVEQRGAALTPEGRRRYDEVMAEATRLDVLRGEKVAEYKALFNEAFPDDWEQLKDQGLIWAQYTLTEKARQLSAASGSHKADQYTPGASTMAQAVEAGLVSWQPILYEDFLPLSAAGIFQSNLRHESAVRMACSAEEAIAESKRQLREALGSGWMEDEMQLYKSQQEESIRRVGVALGISA